jgi:hypothetical protein
MPSDSSIYAPAQQQCTFNNRNKRNGGSQNSGHGFPQQPTMSFLVRAAANSRPYILPLPTSVGRNWNYCHTHGGDVDDTHTSATFGKLGPSHYPNVSRANIMSGSVAGMHKTISPLARCHTLPNCCPQQQQLLSNVCPLPITHLEARPDSSQPLPCSLAECHWPAAPTASRQPWPCRFISPAKE